MDSLAPECLGGLLRLEVLILASASEDGSHPVNMSRTNKTTDFGGSVFPPDLPAATPLLTYLDLGYTGIGGQLPPGEQLAHWRRLEELRLNGNNLIGPLSPELSALSSAAVIKLQRNPSSYTQILSTNIHEVVRLQGGESLGLISHNLTDCFSLAVQGAFPRLVRPMPKLIQLTVGFTGMSGLISEVNFGGEYAANRLLLLDMQIAAAQVVVSDRALCQSRLQSSFLPWRPWTWTAIRCDLQLSSITSPATSCSPIY